MKAQRAFKAVFNREPASAGSLNNEGSRKWPVRLRDMPVYLVCLIGLNLMTATPATAAPPEAPPGITKVCPDTTINTTLDALLGRAWGWADTVGTVVAVLALIALIVVAGNKKGREVVTPYVVLTVGLLVLAGIIIVAITGRSGAC